MKKGGVIYKTNAIKREEYNEKRTGGLEKGHNENGRKREHVQEFKA